MGKSSAHLAPSSFSHERNSIRRQASSSSLHSCLSQGSAQSPPTPPESSLSSPCAPSSSRRRVCARPGPGATDTTAGRPGPGPQGPRSPCAGTDTNRMTTKRNDHGHRSGPPLRRPCRLFGVRLNPKQTPWTHQLSLTKHQVKDKIIKNFNRVTVECEFPSLGPCAPAPYTPCESHLSLHPLFGPS